MSCSVFFLFCSTQFHNKSQSISGKKVKKIGDKNLHSQKDTKTYEFMLHPEPQLIMSSYAALRFMNKAKKLNAQNARFFWSALPCDVELKTL